MKKLEDFGFKKAGNLKLDNEKIKQEIPNEIKSTKDLVYVITIDEEIIYIGETSQRLSERFYDHCNGNSDEKDTDNRTNSEIKKALAQGKNVNVWYLKETTTHTFPSGQTINVSLRQPLEDFLIKALDAKINKARKK